MEKFFNLFVKTQNLEGVIEEPLSDELKLESVCNNLEKKLRDFFSSYVVEADVDIVILITKKSFWSFRLMHEEGKIVVPRNDSKRYFSDRYFYKLLDFTEFDGKRILVVDDTLNKGIAVQHFCELMRTNCPNSIVSVAICCKNNCIDNVEVPGIDYRVYEDAAPDEIGQMCVYETIQFHENLIPYIVDLPVLATINNGKLTRKIRMSIDKFHSICEGNNIWTYHESDYELVPGKKVNAGIFDFYSLFLKNIFEPFLLSLTVKVQYVYDYDKSEVEAVFVPFAMMRSVDTEELVECFDILFEDTPYKKYIDSMNIDINLLSNYYTALYRSIVFYLSMYIGVKFIQYIDIPMPLTLFNEKQFIDCFYESIDQLFPKENNYKNFDELQFLSRILRIESFTKIEDFCDEEIYVNGLKNSDYSEEDWFAYLYEQIITSKRKNTDKRYFTSETFEKNLEEKYDYDKSDEESLSILIATILNEALNKSILSNYLFLGNHGRTLYRGYRYGENSEHLLPYDARIFYKAIFTFYKRFDVDKYMEKVDYFCYLFREFLTKNGYFNYLISERQFQFFVRYFTELSYEEIETQIENKQYLLSEEFCEQTDFMKQVLHKVEDFSLKVNLERG